MCIWKTKKYLRDIVSQNASLILEATQRNLSTLLPKFISMNLHLEKTYISDENKNKGKFKFSINFICIFEV